VLAARPAGNVINWEFCGPDRTVKLPVIRVPLEGNIRNSLGYAEYRAGDFAEATACAERALSIFRAVGDRWGEVDTLTNLCDICGAAGEPLRAREAWQQVSRPSTS
jgi:Tetratricopeptide repeat